VFGAGLASQETQPEVPEEAATEEAAGELEEAERLSEQEKRKLLTGGRSHAELMDDAIRAIAQGDWGSALHASTVGLLLEEYLDELQLAEAYYLQGFVLGQEPVSELLQQAENARAEEAGEEPRPLRAYLGGLSGFEQARVFAGRGDLRLRAIYNLGCLHLLDADAWRAEIPEIAQAQGGGQGAPAGSGMAGMAGMGGMSPAGAEGEEPPDPLANARAGYLRARDWLVQRLKADWHDEDTRANLELIQRRLRELDEIEKEREEQQQEQESDENQEGDEDQNNEEDGESEDSENQEQDGNPEDPDDGQEGDQQQDPGDPGEGEKPEEQQQQQPDEGQEEQAPQPHEGNPENAERHLTREEVMRLLDKLSQMEDEYRALQESLRAARRIPVERDW